MKAYRCGEIIHWNITEQENSASHCGFTYLHCTLLGTGGKQQQDFNKRRAVSCTIVFCWFPLLVFSLYWCKALPPLKLGSCICSVLVREICSSFGTPCASSSSRGLPAEPCSNALVLLYKTSCQGWDIFLFLLLRFWKFAMKKCHKLSNGTWCRCMIFYWIVKFESISNTPTVCTSVHQSTHLPCEYFHIFKNLLTNVTLFLNTVCGNNTIF